VKGFVRVKRIHPEGFSYPAEIIAVIARRADLLVLSIVEGSARRGNLPFDYKIRLLRSDLSELAMTPRQRGLHNPPLEGRKKEGF